MHYRMKNNIKYSFLLSLTLLASIMYGQTETCISFKYDNSGNRVERFSDFDCDGIPLIRKDSLYVEDDLLANDNSSSNDDGKKEVASLNDNSLSTADNFDSIKIYPNPVENMLYINQSLRKEFNANIYYLDGRLIKNKLRVLNYTEIDVEDMLKGVYIIELYADGETPIRFKFQKN